MRWSPSAPSGIAAIGAAILVSCAAASSPGAADDGSSTGPRCRAAFAGTPASVTPAVARGELATTTASGLDEMISFTAITILAVVAVAEDCRTLRIVEVIDSAGTRLPSRLEGRPFAFGASPEELAALGRAATSTILAGTSEGSDHLSLMGVVDEEGRFVSPVWAESFGSLTRQVPGSTEQKLSDLLRRQRVGRLPAEPTPLDAAAEWLARPPQQRGFDAGSTPTQILEDLTTTITLRVEIPEKLRAGPGEVIEEPHITFLRIYQPDVAEVFAIALAAGHYEGPAFVPEGEVFAQFVHEASGTSSTPVSLGSLADLAVAAPDGESVTVRVEDGGYAGDGVGIESLRVTTGF